MLLNFIQISQKFAAVRRCDVVTHDVLQNNWTRYAASGCFWSLGVLLCYLQ